MSKQTRILVSTGDGKGKTTAALGLALRAAGHAMRVCIIQFIKNDASTGELSAIAKLPGVEIVQTGRGVLPDQSDATFVDHQAAAVSGLAKAAKAIGSGDYAVVILDEVCLAVARNLLDEKAVCDVVRTARADSCLVLTGRYATPGLIAMADTVTEMRCVKHGMEMGIPAQKGVEF